MQRAKCYFKGPLNPTYIKFLLRSRSRPARVRVRLLPAAEPAGALLGQPGGHRVAGVAASQEDQEAHPDAEEVGIMIIRSMDPHKIMANQNSTYAEPYGIVYGFPMKTHRARHRPNPPKLPISCGDMHVEARRADKAIDVCSQDLVLRTRKSMLQHMESMIKLN